MSRPNPFSYTWTPAVPVGGSGGRVTTSRTELFHILVAFAVLTIDLAFLFGSTGVLFGAGGTGLFPSGALLPLIATAATAAITGFVAHELAHKVVAERRGYWAEFRMSPLGLVISFVTVFLLGVLWAAPGATVVNGMSPADREGWGRTSIAGPLTNVAFGVVFYAAALGTAFWNQTVAETLLLLAFIGAWFGTFNLIPIGPLDGRKVWNWNRGYWAAAIFGTAALAVVTWFAAFYYLSPFLGY